MITGRTKIAGVVGTPIAHSLSPLLMNSWIAASGLDAAYLALPATEDFSASDFRCLAKAGLLGVNITLPFKEVAARAADKLTKAAAMAEASNLLVYERGIIRGENTDIIGIDYALRCAGLDFAEKTVLVLGAGGAARAVCIAASLGNARDVIVCNRSPDRAEALAGRFERVSANDWSNRNQVAGRADLIVNATSLGLDGKSDPGIDWSACQKGAAVFDMIYSPLRRPFETGAAAAGLTIISGLSMLIGQARPSFVALFGAPVPDTVAVDALLRKALNNERL